MHIRNLLAILLILSASGQVASEVFIYIGPNGDKMITDHPVRQEGYRLLSEKKTLRNVGRIMANRAQTAVDEEHYRETIDEASNRYGIDPALVEAVIRTESSFNPRALSKKGASGLMQLSDATATHYRVYDSMSPEENINAGVKHLSMLIKRFNGELPLVLAAYNAGETAVAKFKGIPPYPETQRYIKKVLNFHSHYWRRRNNDEQYPYEALL